MTKRFLDELNISQLYNFILFALYKLKHNSDYLALSELMFLLDKDDVLTLFEYYGGMTITIPTIEELQTVIKAMNVYIDVTFNHKDESECLANIPKDEKTEVLKCYHSMTTLLSDYNFNT